MTPMSRNTELRRKREPGTCISIRLSGDALSQLAALKLRSQE
jgi:hypothetical protein